MNPLRHSLRGFSVALKIANKVSVVDRYRKRTYQWMGRRFHHQFTVCVEGNIGSGKSTLLRYLARVMDVDITPEPVNKWQDLRGTNLLEKMYTDPEKWGFIFQSYVQLTMLEGHLIESPFPVKLMERSLHSARHCFVENMYRTGKIREMEYLVYDEWYDMFTKRLDCGVDLIVYLRTDPLTAHKRIAARARAEEQTIPLQYCKELHERYEEWIGGSEVPAPVVVIDANESLQKMNIKYEYILKVIRKSSSKSVSC